MKQVYHTDFSYGKAFQKMIQKAGKCNIMDNIEKNRYVRTAITEALLDLLAEKELDKITVSEITAKAEVGRVSFYRNYKTKEDI